MDKRRSDGAQPVPPAGESDVPIRGYGPGLVRAVNGDGARCGCGKRSALHVIECEGARFDYFLCGSCALGAAITWLAARNQDRFGSAATAEYADLEGIR